MSNNTFDDAKGNTPYGLYKEMLQKLYGDLQLNPNEKRTRLTSESWMEKVRLLIRYLIILINNPNDLNYVSPRGVS